uniref:Uncharacterized protein n=1 Tax=Parascaris univalens TaxID=6257 RepID=A0A915A2B8_PARUN
MTIITIIIIIIPFSPFASVLYICVFLLLFLPAITPTSPPQLFVRGYCSFPRPPRNILVPQRVTILHHDDNKPSNFFVYAFTSCDVIGCLVENVGPLTKLFLGLSHFSCLLRLHAHDFCPCCVAYLYVFHALFGSSCSVCCYFFMRG